MNGKLLILFPLLLFCCTSTNKKDKPINKNSILTKLEEPNSITKDKEGQDLIVICFIAKDVFINNDNIDKSNLKDKLKYLVNNRLKEGMQTLSIQVFYEDIKFINYEPLVQQIKDICKAYLDKEAVKKYNKAFEKLSNLEKNGLRFKLFITESEKRLMDEYNIPNHLKCN